MKFLNALLSVGLLVLSVSGITGEEAEYVRGKDPQADAIYDMQMGMNGLKQATKDPQLLAQLVQDLQDPEMMKEARKMMDSPEFKKQMKSMEKSKEFKDAANKAKEMMQDPSTAARIQAQMEHMVQRGQDTIKKNAESSMAEAMNAMTDPAVMAEAAKMMKDPSFNKQMQEMANDPAFKNYIIAMQEMMKDPDQKKKMEDIANVMKSAL